MSTVLVSTDNAPWLDWEHYYKFYYFLTLLDFDMTMDSIVNKIIQLDYDTKYNWLKDNLAH